MTPVLEVAHVRRSFAVVRLEEVVDFTIVELIGDDIRNASLGSTSSDVLAVVSTTDGSRSTY